MFSNYFASKNNDNGDPVLELRDFYQLMILDEIFTSRYRMYLILKGLTAARLGYGLGKGDDKIELTTLETIPSTEFLLNLKKMLKKLPNIRICSDYEKRYTYNIEIQILDEAKELKFTIELSKLKYNWKRGINYDVKSLRCKSWEYCVIANVVSLNEIMSEYSSNQDLLGIRL